MYLLFRRRSDTNSSRISYEELPHSIFLYLGIVFFLVRRHVTSSIDLKIYFKLPQSVWCGVIKLVQTSQEGILQSIWDSGSYGGPLISHKGMGFLSQGSSLLMQGKVLEVGVYFCRGVDIRVCRDVHRSRRRVGSSCHRSILCFHWGRESFQSLICFPSNSLRQSRHIGDLGSQGYSLVSQGC